MLGLYYVANRQLLVLLVQEDCVLIQSETRYAQVGQTVEALAVSQPGQSTVCGYKALLIHTAHRCRTHSL